MFSYCDADSLAICACANLVSVMEIGIYYTKDGFRGVCSIFHLLHENGAFLTFEEFNVTFGLNINFLTYNGRGGEMR